MSEPVGLNQGDLVSFGQDVVFLLNAVEEAEIVALQDAALAREAPVDGSLVELALSERADAKLADYLQALSRLSVELTSLDNRTQLLEATFDVLQPVISADRFIAMLGRQVDQLQTVARKIVNADDSAQLQPPSSGILRRALVGKQAVISFDAQTDVRFKKRDSIASGNIRSALCVGLKHGDASLGVLYADNRVAAGLFSLKDGEFLQLVGRIVAMRLAVLEARDRNRRAGPGDARRERGARPGPHRTGG